MADITLISGSTLGGAEYVAEHLAEKLEAAGFSTETVHGPLLEDLSTSNFRDLADNQLNARRRRHSGQPDPFL